MPHTGSRSPCSPWGLVLSAVVGLARGRLTRMWVENGRVSRQGTFLTSPEREAVAA